VSDALHDPYPLLARYLAHECSAQERAAVERWMASDPAHRQELEALRALWDGAADLPPAARTDAMWDSLSRRIAAAKGTPRRHVIPLPAPVAMPPHRRPAAAIGLLTREAPGRSRWRAAASAVAAGVVLAAGAAFAWQTWRAQHERTAEQAPLREFATARGQRATIRLVDGTRVELGFASTLRVRPFDGGRRELWVEGEAVFDVVHDSTRPFIVHAANATTEDLGTTFAVRAYPGDAAVRVVVVSGKVALRQRVPVPGAQPREAVLGPGQLGRLDGEGRLEVESGVDTSAYVAWLAGRVTFHDARLDEVAAELERRFDVTIRIPDARVAARRVTVDMPAATLPPVLDAITTPLQLRHRRAGGDILLER
jgi:transmembrane sensor